jgi:hypothetical protein
VDYYLAIKKNEIRSFEGKMDEIGDWNVKQNKPDSEKQMAHTFSAMQNLDFNKQRDMKA